MRPIDFATGLPNRGNAVTIPDMIDHAATGLGFVLAGTISARIVAGQLLSLLVCWSSPVQGLEPVRGGTVVVAVASDPGGLNPAITTQGGVHLICGSIFSGLVAHDFELKPVPDLAERWEVSTDGRTYTFHLAPNAVFHDGAPVTSADVKFTFEQLLLKYHSRARASIGDNLRQIETPDPHTVIFNFDHPYAAFLQLVDVTNAPVLPKHLYDGADPLTNPHNTRPIGSGPFKFQEWLKGDHLTLVRNNRYFKSGKPYLDRIVYKVIPEAAMATIAFERGEVDYLLNPSPLDPARLRNEADVILSDKGREGFATVETLIPNLTRAPLSDLRVRQEIAHAINKDYLVDKLLLGMGRPATGPVSHLLVDRIRTETHYPLLPPVVTPLSQSYFKIYPELNLLCVPLSERNFLLHLPDIYHELAHPLIAEKYDPRVKPFQDALSRALDLVLGYLEEELEREARSRGPKEFIDNLYGWSNAWVGGWAIELFCDLFAVYTLGPAFVWSHLHLSATRGKDPYHTLSYASHPSDAARMATMLSGLRLAGFDTQASTLQERWNELMLISAATPEPEYDRCFPNYILQGFAQEAQRGVSEIGCRGVSSETKDIVHSALNDAWDDFWNDPEGYATKEKALVTNLKAHCSDSFGVPAE